MGCPPCNFPVSLSKDEVFLEEALLNLQAMTPHQRDGGFSDKEEEACMEFYDHSSSTWWSCVAAFSDLALSDQESPGSAIKRRDKSFTLYSSVMVLHSCITSLAGTRFLIQRNLTLNKGLSCPNKRAAFRKMKMITGYSLKCSSRRLNHNYASLEELQVPWHYF